jgi:hypothetical protein
MFGRCPIGGEKKKTFWYVYSAKKNNKQEVFSWMSIRELIELVKVRDTNPKC